MFAFEFEFKNHTYQGLARIKTEDTGTRYAVTIMNGDLESLLYGKHFFGESDGILTPCSIDGSDGVKELQNCVAIGLQRSIIQETAH